MFGFWRTVEGASVTLSVLDHGVEPKRDASTLEGRHGAARRYAGRASAAKLELELEQLAASS